MTSINYNEFQPGQGVSAPDLNENFTLTNNAIENMELTLNSAISSLTSTSNLKADKNGSSTEKFYVADATEDTQAVNLRQLQTAGLNIVGTIIWYAGSSVPDGYLLCDGTAYSREDYADLFSVIGIKYGAGDASTTFNLPDLIGRFAQGASVAGTYHDAGLPNITGWFGINQNADEAGGNTWGGAFNRSYHGGDQGADGDGAKSTQYDFNASRSSAIYGNSDTVQPAALTLLPCIKY